MLDKLQLIFNDVFDRTDIILSEDTVIKEVPDMTSLSMIILISEIENAFDIMIPNEQIKKFKTVKDITSFLKEGWIG